MVSPFDLYVVCTAFWTSGFDVDAVGLNDFCIYFFIYFCDISAAAVARLFAGDIYSTSPRWQTGFLVDGGDSRSGCGAFTNT